MYAMRNHGGQRPPPGGAGPMSLPKRCSKQWHPVGIVIHQPLPEKGLLVLGISTSGISPRSFFVEKVETASVIRPTLCCVQRECTSCDIALQPRRGQLLPGAAGGNALGFDFEP
mmetsp:Transcript_49302/g.127157  ORF Transcript_49302/g.127157 Transcript_49302/m.127157 type:complete len:114 (+) Transcript_49302:1109-1450(+)